MSRRCRNVAFRLGLRPGSDEPRSRDSIARPLSSWASHPALGPGSPSARGPEPVLPTQRGHSQPWFWRGCCPERNLGLAVAAVASSTLAMLLFLGDIQKYSWCWCCAAKTGQISLVRAVIKFYYLEFSTTTTAEIRFTPWTIDKWPLK